MSRLKIWNYYACRRCGKKQQVYRLPEADGSTLLYCQKCEAVTAHRTVGDEITESAEYRDSSPLFPSDMLVG